jgi:hypothetical protein
MWVADVEIGFLRTVFGGWWWWRRRRRTMDVFELELQEVGMQRGMASLGRTPRAGGPLRTGADIGPRPRLARDSPSPRHRHDRAEVAVDPTLDTFAITHRTALRVVGARELREEHLLEGLQVELEHRRGGLPLLKVRLRDPAIGDPGGDPRADAFVLASEELPDRGPRRVLMLKQSYARDPGLLV